MGEVAAITGVDVERLLLEAGDDEVIRTDNAQLATFALSLVAYHDLLARGVRPRYHLGHSLGEFSALTAAGVLSLEDGARLIATRGAAMAAAAQARAGSMVALLGGDEEARGRLAGRADLWVANVNGAGQLVVSGTPDALADLVAVHRELGFRRATPLPVGGAFHSPLMAPAQAALDAQLATVTWRESDVVVIANVDGAAHTGAQWHDLLARQLTSPVEFVRATGALPATVTVSIEMPPGAVLTGLTRRIRDFDAQVALAGPADLEAVA